MKLYENRITKKSQRKLLVAAEMKSREYRSVFSQLTPLDEYRVRRLANAEVKKIDYGKVFLPHVRVLWDFVDACYRHAKQITDTVVV